MWLSAWCGNHLQKLRLQHKSYCANCIKQSLIMLTVRWIHKKGVLTFSCDVDGNEIFCTYQSHTPFILYSLGLKYNQLVVMVTISLRTHPPLTSILEREWWFLVVRDLLAGPRWLLARWHTQEHSNGKDNPSLSHHRFHIFLELFLGFPCWHKVYTASWCRSNVWGTAHLQILRPYRTRNKDRSKRCSRQGCCWNNQWYRS